MCWVKAGESWIDLQGFIGLLILAGVWCQDELCVEHAGLHWWTWRWTARKVSGKACGPRHGVLSPGTHHHMQQFFHLVCSWSGAAQTEPDHDWTSKKGLILRVGLHWHTYSCVLLFWKKKCAFHEHASLCTHLWHIPASACLLREAQHKKENEPDTAPAQTKRKRCQACPQKNIRKTSMICHKCKNHNGPSVFECLSFMILNLCIFV